MYREKFTKKTNLQKFRAQNKNKLQCITRDRSNGTNFIGSVLEYKIDYFFKSLLSI